MVFFCLQPGYRCLSCKSALHCYPGNFALLVQCAGIFAYCRNGYCSRFKSNECELLESDHHSITSHSSTLPPYVQQEFNLINKTTEAPAVLSDMDSKPQESTSNVISTQLNDPNRIDGSMTSDEQTNDPAKVNVTETNKNK